MSTHAFTPTFKPFDFLAPAPGGAFEEAAAASEPVYALVQSGPAVSSEEVESHLDAVEVTIKWGAQIMKVAHLEGGRSFVLGSDFVVPEDVLGAARATLVAGSTAFVPETATSANLERRGEGIMMVPPGSQVTLAPGARLTIELGAFTIELGAVRAGKVLPAGFLSALATGAASFIGLSALGHAAIVASMALFMPSMTNDAESLDRDQLLLMQKMLTAAAERENEMQEMPGASDAPAAGGGKQSGEAHQGEAGQAGTTRHVTTNGRMAFRGDNQPPEVGRRAEMEEARTFGLVGILGGEKNAPSSPWGEHHAGSDPLNAQGSLFAQTIDDASGFGLGLWGTGEGGGGKGKGVGIDGVGSTIGGGSGTCTGNNCFGRGDKDGFGISSGKSGGGHVAKAPVFREVGITTNGKLPPEVIQRVVRQNFGKFRFCYDAGLRQNPALTGRVSTRFVIDRNGAVSLAQDAGSDLPNREVVQCIVRSFHSLSFPEPQGGMVTVTYPIMLTPGE